MYNRIRKYWKTTKQQAAVLSVFAGMISGGAFGSLLGAAAQIAGKMEGAMVSGGSIGLIFGCVYMYINILNEK